jgi:hypothetical protein
VVLAYTINTVKLKSAGGQLLLSGTWLKPWKTVAEAYLQEYEHQPASTLVLDLINISKA